MVVGVCWPLPIGIGERPRVLLAARSTGDMLLSVLDNGDGELVVVDWLM